MSLMHSLLCATFRNQACDRTDVIFQLLSLTSQYYLHNTLKTQGKSRVLTFILDTGHSFLAILKAK